MDKAQFRDLAKAFCGARPTLKLRVIGGVFATCALALPTTSALASQEIVAKVTYTGTFGDGHLYVGLDTMINEPGCPMPRFDVPGNHPNIKNFIATALAAAASGRAITIKTSGCFSGYPTLDQGSGGYFSIHGQ